MLEKPSLESSSQFRRPLIAGSSLTSTTSSYSLLERDLNGSAGEATPSRGGAGALPGDLTPPRPGAAPPPAGTPAAAAPAPQPRTILASAVRNGPLLSPDSEISDRMRDIYLQPQPSLGACVCACVCVCVW